LRKRNEKIPDSALGKTERTVFIKQSSIFNVGFNLMLFHSHKSMIESIRYAFGGRPSLDALAMYRGFTNPSTNVIGLMFCSRENLTIKVLSHECGHATLHYLRHSGCSVDDTSEEFFSEILGITMENVFVRLSSELKEYKLVFQ
jgi:hypothetical protein